MDLIKVGKILGGVGLLYFGVLRGAKGLKFGLQSYSFEKVDLTNMTINLRLNIQIKNPLLVGLTIKGVIGDVYAQGVKIGAVNTKYNYYIAGGKTHVLPVVVNLSMANIGEAAVQNILSGDIKTLNVAFNGKVLVGKYEVGVPVKFGFDYKDLTE